MKLNLIGEFKINELESFAFVSMLLGASIFLVTCFWDNLVGIQISHHEGYGLAQIAVMFLSGMYSLWALWIIRCWGEK